MRTRNGWVFMDIMMGMIIVALLAAILGAAAAMNQRGLQHLNDTRAAARQAESALLTMQSNQKTAANSTGHLSYEKLQASQVPGLAWVQVRATVNTRSATLIGLVPQPTLGEK